MKNLADVLNESLVNEVWFKMSDPEYIKNIRLGKEKERDENKKAMVDYADKNDFKIDLLRTYDTSNNLDEYEIPIMIIGDPEDKDQVCIAIEMERLELTFYYYYRGACFRWFDNAAEIYPELKEKIDIIPEIPSSWTKESYTAGRRGALLDEFEKIVKKAVNLQKKMRL